MPLAISSSSLPPPGLLCACKHHLPPSTLTALPSRPLGASTHPTTTPQPCAQVRCLKAILSPLLARGSPHLCRITEMFQQLQTGQPLMDPLSPTQESPLSYQMGSHCSTCSVQVRH